MKHKHHIIPKHAGGTDDPENLIELTVNEHAAEHRKLYDQYGKWQDLLAYKTLSGQISSNEEARIEAIRMSQKERVENGVAKLGAIKAAKTRKERGIAAWNKGMKLKNDPTNPALQKLRENNLNARAEGKQVNIGDLVRGRPHSMKQRQMTSERIKNQELITCAHCGKQAKNAMYYRWHGDNCRNKTVNVAVTDGEDLNTLGKKT